MRILKTTIIVGSILLILIFSFGLWLFWANRSGSNAPENVSLPPQFNNDGGLSVEARPLSASFNAPFQFEISFNTHQGNLDFDLKEQAALEDDRGNSYKPVEWRGPQGGHHISGILIFPPIKKTDKIKLAIYNIYGVEKRVFEWDLK